MEACDVRTLTIILSLALVSTPVLADVVQRDAAPYGHQPLTSGELEAIYTAGTDGEPWTQDAKLEPDEPRPNEWTGYAVDMDGDTVVIGAPSDPDANRAGRAFVYEHGPDGWSQSATLTGDQPGDMFGFAVAIEDDTVVVGAPKGDTPDAGFAGGVHIYERGEEGWTKTSTFAGDDSHLGDAFGSALALEGDTLVVGAYAHEIQGLDGAGSAYVFHRNADGWQQTAKLQAPEPSYYTRFGRAVDAEAGTILVGAYLHSGEERYGGTAYLFEKDDADSGWTQVTQLNPNTPGAYHFFGYAVALHGSTALVGAPGQHNFDYPGAVYVYARGNEGTWNQAAHLEGDGDPENTFGRSIAFDGRLAVIGATSADDLDIPDGIPPAPSQGNYDGSGAAFLYTGDSGTWSLEGKLVAEDRSNHGPVVTDQGAPPWDYDRFGSDVALSDSRIIAGSSGDDTPAGKDTGSAYIFRPGCQGETISLPASPPLPPCLRVGGDAL